MRNMLMIACLLSLATICGCRTDPTPEERAEQWRKAAEQGDAEAQYELGHCYHYGYGVTEDKTEAVKWYRMAAEQGHVYAQCWLGVCYFIGNGVTQDKTEAIKWYRKAAEWGHEEAKDALKRLEQRGGTAP